MIETDPILEDEKFEQFKSFVQQECEAAHRESLLGSKPPQEIIEDQLQQWLVDRYGLVEGRAEDEPQLVSAAPSKGNYRREDGEIVRMTEYTHENTLSEEIIWEVERRGTLEIRKCCSVE